MCAVFAHETGQLDAAQKLAQAAAAAKPDYKSELPLLAPLGAYSLVFSAVYKRLEWRSFCFKNGVRVLVIILTLFVSLSLTDARPVPLTVKDISLMLRTGYSNEAVLHELSVRHFADTCDESAKKMLTQSGASPALINALNSGSYAVPAEEAARAQEQIIAESKRRAAIAEESRKFDTLYQHQLAQKRLAAPAFPSGDRPMRCIRY